MKRRAFIKNTSLLVGSWSLGIHLSGCENPTVPNADTESFMPSAFLNFTQQGDIIFQLHRAEMGQGNFRLRCSRFHEQAVLLPFAQSSARRAVCSLPRAAPENLGG